MSNIKYEIDESNTVRLWHLDNPLENNEPHLFQPINPETGVAFKTNEEARNWVEALVLKINNPEMPALEEGK